MPIVIDLNIPGADQVESRFERIIEKMNELDKAYRNAAQGFTVGKGSQATHAARTQVGIYSRLTRERERLNDAIAKGSDLEIKDARAAVFNAQKRVEAHERRVKMAERGLPEWLSTARVAIGPNGKLQLMPLMNRLIEAGISDGSHSGILNLAGGAGAAGARAAVAGGGGAAFTSAMALAKLAAPVAVLALAGVALKKGADAFANATAPYSRAHWSGGGTGRQTAAAVLIGSFLGMDPGSVGDRANALSQRLLQGGYGAGHMRARGITGAGWWRANQMGTYLRAIDELRNIPDDERAIRVARDLGLTDELRVRDLSPSTYQALRSSSAAAASPRARRAASEYDANKAIIGRELESMWVSATTPIMKSIASGLTDIRDGFSMSFYDATIGGWKRLGTTKGWKELFSGDTNPWLEASRERKRKEAEIDSKEGVDAIRELTRALRDTTDAINIGNRGGQAVPAAWRHQMMEDALLHQARALGSWTI